MINAKPFRKFIGLFFVLAFSSTLLIKASHFLYMHHEHGIISSTQHNEFNKTPKKCPVCAFEFTEFISAQHQAPKAPPPIYSEVIQITYQKKINSAFFYTFNLRAPPQYS